MNQNRENRQQIRDQFLAEKTKKLDGLLFTESPSKYTFSSGIYTLDKATRGFPAGKFIGVYGPTSTGKTSLVLRLAGQVNKINWDSGEYDESLKNPCGGAFIDLEDSFDIDWALNLGFDINLPENNLSKVVGGENVGDLVKDMIDSDLYSVIITDSFESMMPLNLIDESMEQNEHGRRAQLLAKCFRKWLPALVRSGQRNKETPWRIPMIVYLNHAQLKPMITYTEYVIPGGGAQRYYASLELMMSKIAYNKEDKKEFGTGSFKGVVDKNKFSGERGRIFTFDMALKDLDENTPAGTVDNAADILRDIKDYEIMEKTDKGYKILGQNYKTQAEFKDMLRSDPAFERQVWAKMIDTVRG